MLNRIKNVIDMFKGMEEGTLEGLRYTLIFFVIINLFVFYWWLEWKTLGMGMLVVAISFLAIILLLESRLRNKAYDQREDRIKYIKTRINDLKK